MPIHSVTSSVWVMRDNAPVQVTVNGVVTIEAVNYYFTDATLDGDITITEFWPEDEVKATKAELATAVGF